MNLNASIIDHQVRGLAERARAQLTEALEKTTLDETTARSAAFVALCVKVLLDIPEDEAIEALTEGGDDFGVDAIEVGDVVDNEFVVTLFQGKYHHANLEGLKGFPEEGVIKAVQAVRMLFDPRAQVQINPRLRAQVAEIHSRLLDSYIPTVRFLLCSNGQAWKVPEAQAIIDREGFDSRVRFEHVNHDTLVRILQSTAPVKDTLTFSGKALVEDLNYTRVFIGKLPVTELARLMEAHGDRLLERNIRRYLGLHGNRVNEGIERTLRSESERQNFYFYNNGLTLICDRFDYNALQREDHRVHVEGLQIINGGQTSKTVQTTISRSQRPALPGTGVDFSSAYVLVRLYQVAESAKPLVQMITYATNSQNPVDLRDLRSNDPRQQQLELSIRSLGYEYRRQRQGGGTTAQDISAGAAAEAVLAVWREKPQLARFRASEHFGKLYDEIFTADLNGAQVVLAVLLWRIAENLRKRPPDDAPEFVRYASCFIAMLMGMQLTFEMKVKPKDLDHRNFDAARALIETNWRQYQARAIRLLEVALKKLHGEKQVGLARLSATFRRGDLFEYLADSAGHSDHGAATDG